MDSQGSASFLKIALARLSADVFFHPLWLHFPVTGPGEAAALAGEMQRAAKQLAFEGSGLDACRVILICAYLQSQSGKGGAALKSLRFAHQMAGRYSLIGAEIWASWGAGAVCAQIGAYAEAARHLQTLQQELYRANEWVLANLIELVQQSLLERSTAGTRSESGLPASAQDKPGLLLEQLFCWGNPPPEIAAELGWPAFPAAYLGTGEQARAGARLSFWQTLRGFLRGELRLQFTPVSRPAAINPAARAELLFEPGESTARETEMPSIPAAAQPSGEHLAEPLVFPLSTAPVHSGNDRDISETVVPQTAAVEAASSAGEVQEHAHPQETEPAAVLAESRPPDLPVEPARVAAPLMGAHLLGSFRVELNGAGIEDWPNGRGRAVFAYLLAHHAHPVPREVLMEAFWPEATLDSARNSLNVAVYTLRQALKKVLDIPVILLHDSAYQINPEIRLCVDIEEFEHSARAAIQHETSGAMDAAMPEYRTAISLYQGDLLADTPYEGWTTLERERLRVLYLEALDHLSILYFSQGLYGDCIGLCQQILQHDACREDVHCRLMRCYARQGQLHLALRQYQACVEALRVELDVPPSPITVQLYELIKRQETV